MRIAPRAAVGTSTSARDGPSKAGARWFPRSSWRTRGAIVALAACAAGLAVSILVRAGPWIEIGFFTSMAACGFLAFAGRARRAEAAAPDRIDPVAAIADLAGAVVSAVWVLESGAGCVFANSRWTEFTGRSARSAAGDGWQQAVHPDDRSRLRELVDRAARGLPCAPVDGRLLGPDGSSRPVSLNAAPWTGEAGRIRGVIATATDQARQRETDRELSEIRAALEHIGEGVARVDHAGRYDRVNPSLAEMHGHTPESMIGLEAESLVHPEDRSAYHTDLARLQREVRVEGERRGVRRDGSSFLVRAVLVAVRGPRGRVDGHYAFLNDITAHRHGEEQLRETLAHHQEMLRRENLLRHELDHRVRNNLAGLLGLVTIYERSGRSGREIGAAIKGKLRAMKEVHDLLSRGKGRPIDLAEFIGRLAREFAPADRLESVRILGPRVEIPAPQAGALAMILQELFMNSRKHGALGRAGGGLVVEWSAVRDVDDHNFELAWRESGAGPAARSPDSGHVGLKLIEGLAASELRGSCEPVLDERGFSCVLRATLDLSSPVSVAQPV